MTPPVPITSAASDGATPVGISVRVNPLLTQVVVQIGDQAIGLPPGDAVFLAQRLVAAVDTLRELNARQVKQ